MQKSNNTSALDQTYWNKHYLENDTPWDIGELSPPLKTIIDNLDDPNMRILIPGAGFGHEAIYLHRKGFKSVIVCDWAESSFQVIKAACNDFPQDHLICSDFFELEGEYDLILEQTFFCAIHPSVREQYVNQVRRLLCTDGVFTGLFFATEFSTPGPPFGGTKRGYIELFEKSFHIESIEIAPNSILPRQGNELLFRMKKK